MKMHEKTFNLVILAMFTAIIAMLAFLPIGFIPLPFGLRPTTIHIPVIIGSLVLGPKYGAFLGFVFGLVSFLNNSFFNPIPTSFVFSPFINLPGQDSGSLLSLIIVFIPRILVGIVPWYVCQGLKKLLSEKRMPLNWAISAIAGSLTNTFLVLGLIYFIFGETWNSARANPADVVLVGIMGLITSNGIPEAIVAGIIVTAVVGALTVAIKPKQEAHHLTISQTGSKIFQESKSVDESVEEEQK